MDRMQLKHLIFLSSSVSGQEALLHTNKPKSRVAVRETEGKCFAGSVPPYCTRGLCQAFSRSPCMHTALCNESNFPVTQLICN